jgi:hypothetical protein
MWRRTHQSFIRSLLRCKDWQTLFHGRAHIGTHQLSVMILLQVKTLTSKSGSMSHVIRNVLITLRGFEDQELGALTELASSLTPLVIDLGKHVLVKPSTQSEHAHVVSIQQLTLMSLYHQAYITGFKPIPSLCCIQPPFWLAPGARAFCNETPGLQVVMVFACFSEYQSIFQPGMQDVAESVVEKYKACVQQAVDICNGYECQEVNAVFMLTFPDCYSAIRFPLVLQQIILVADWTPEMLCLPPMKPEWDKDGNLLHRGPRVKTGVYRGEPRSVTPHSTTGRADYWGELVNRAARMMSAAKGGQVLCTEDITTEVRVELLTCNELDFPGLGFQALARGSICHRTDWHQVPVLSCQLSGM